MMKAASALMQAPGSSEQAPGSSEQASPHSEQASPQTEGAKLFRGRTVEELIPKIEAELGPEAIVLRRRSGLEGGMGGFFQRPFVEIEAERGARIDVYDGSTEVPPSSPADTAPRAAHPVTAAYFAQRAHAPEPAVPHAATGTTIAQAGAPGLTGAPQTGAPDFAALDLATVLEPRSGGEAPAPDAFAAALAAAGLDAGLDADHDPIRAAAIAPEASGAPATTLPHTPYANDTDTLPDTPYATDTDTLPDTPYANDTDTLPDTPYATDTDTLPHTPYANGAAAGVAAARPSQPRPEPSKTELALRRELVGTGISQPLADELIAEAHTHVLPFQPRIGLRRAVKLALSRRIATGAPLPVGGAAIAFVGAGGSGKTRCVAALSAVYRRSGRTPVGCASLIAGAEGEPLRMLLSPRVPMPVAADARHARKALHDARAEGLLILDTPPASPAERGSVREISRVLSQIGPDRVVVALPATLGATAAKQLLSALAPLKPHAIAITHADETDQLGVAVQAACDFGLAPEYLLCASRGERALSRLHATELAERLLP